ncbi:uncharacterized protein EV420DRAFT_1477561 [Desarmillaria tabescens]|uniref:Uncharacterized protein n=1 Tax=Armillaria tabescens TaxID=1929756 RepID=A0AA39NA42_ARMTA|nr:uncharacterized protein EV420DRAFT_1477561 [Desarmillaria tabescens]KAK0461841.1 hypothetical protein EV420DRAFT_1477561 [Desarmillaria tabescens]
MSKHVTNNRMSIDGTRNIQKFDEVDAVGMLELLDDLSHIREFTFYGVDLETSEQHLDVLMAGMKGVETFTFENCILSASTFNSVFSDFSSYLFMTRTTSLSQDEPCSENPVSRMRPVIEFEFYQLGFGVWYIYISLLGESGPGQDLESYAWSSCIQLPVLQNLSVNFQVRSDIASGAEHLISSARFAETRTCNVFHRVFTTEDHVT